MKVAVVSCFDAYHTRLCFVENFFLQSGCEVVTILSDFDHAKKQRRIYEYSNREVEIISVPEYKKNLSLRRIYSHFCFAQRAYRFIRKSKDFDMIYAMIPPNFLCYYLGKYKKKKKEIKLIFDLYDLWPESMINGKRNGLLTVPFAVWAGLRNRQLKMADYVLTECSLYRERLKDFLVKGRTDTMYISKKSAGLPLYNGLNDREVSLCYLGSINHIIDIDGIAELIAALSVVKPVVLHIIGDGEKKDEFIERAKASGAVVEYHGMVYEENYKREVFSKCHFGINMMRSSVCVGLSQKSIDYFEAGLPVINTIPYDTKRLIESWKCGINISDGHIDEAVQYITGLDRQKYLELRNNTVQMFLEEFSEEKIVRTMKKMCEIIGYAEYL